jgi:hypothetical protein
MGQFRPITPTEFNGRDLIQIRLRRFEVLAQQAHKLLDHDIELFRDTGRRWHQIRLDIRNGRIPNPPQAPPSLPGAAQMAFSNAPSAAFLHRTGADFLTNYTKCMLGFLDIMQANTCTVGSMDELDQRQERASRALENLKRMRATMGEFIREVHPYILYLIRLESENEEYLCGWYEEWDRTGRPEWSEFLDWISTFPETRRLVANGRPLEHIAVEMLEEHAPESLSD